MSFEAYLRSIKARTGKSPEELRDLAIDAGVFTPTMRATELITWLKQEFQLGHGHSMAVWAVFKSKGWVQPAGHTGRRSPGCRPKDKKPTPAMS